MFNALVSKITSFAAKQIGKVGLTVTKHKADILFIGGIGCIAGGTITAIVKSSEASNCLDEFHTYVERIHDSVAKAEEQENPEEYYPLEQRQQDTAIVYKHMIKAMAKIYLPVVALEVVGIMMLCKSHRTLTKQNASLAASCAALSKSFNEYRKRVRDRFGEDVEQEIYNGYVTTTYKELETSENGITTEKEVTKEEYNPLSPFSFMIGRRKDENPWEWTDPYMILSEIESVQRKMNYKMSKKNMLGNARPFVTMNEIAQEFNIPLRPEWSTWVVYKDLNDDTDTSLLFGVSQDNAKIEGTQEWKFVNKIIDGLWLCPNINGNLCDDLDIQFRNAGIKKMKEEADVKWKNSTIRPLK